MTDLGMLNQATEAFQHQMSQPKLSLSEDKPVSEFQQTLEKNMMNDPAFMKTMQRKKIKDTAVEFEAQFLSQMLQPMFEGVQAEEPFGGGHAEKMWQGMLVNEYGKAIAKNGGIGLADEVERQLLRAQEGL